MLLIHEDGLRRVCVLDEVQLGLMTRLHLLDETLVCSNMPSKLPVACAAAACAAEAHMRQVNVPARPCSTSKTLTPLDEPSSENPDPTSENEDKRQDLSHSIQTHRGLG